MKALYNLTGCTILTVAEQYRFGDVKNDSKRFIIAMQKLFKVYNAADDDQGVLMRTGLLVLWF